MSRRNGRTKQLEVELKKEILLLEDELLELQEENSELRNLIDLQNDYIKTELKTIKDKLAMQHQYQKYLGCRWDDEQNLRRHMDNKLRDRLANLELKIEQAKRTFIGKRLFKRD